MIKKTARGCIYGKTGQSITVIFKTITGTATDKCSGTMVECIRVNG